MKNTRKEVNRLPYLRQRSRRKGFTLVQILVVLSIILVLASITVGVLANGRKTAYRGQCDTNIKAIAIALDAFREENDQYPSQLSDLPSRKYLDNAEFLHCPADPRDDGSYADFYIPRPPRSGVTRPGSPTLVKTEPPIVVCPFHEDLGNHGVQGFVGRSTKQFATKPAYLMAAAGTTVQRPGEEPIPATANMELHGGDRIRTSGGMATIKFADGSTCEIESQSDVTVLQSFVQGNSQSSVLYSIVRQISGTVTYTVNEGSDFDVVTPTVTAGAMGTKFKITVGAGGTASILVTEGAVYLATLKTIAKAPFGVLYNILPGLPGLPSILPPILDGLPNLPNIPGIPGL